MVKMLAVVTDVSVYSSGDMETGLWLSELTHVYHSAKEQGYQITIASPKGGSTPIDPESLKPLVLDKIESLARRKKEVPFNLEVALKERGANYKKAFIPMTSKVVIDGNLITGQNPFSSKEMAKVVMQQLKAKLIKEANTQ